MRYLFRKKNTNIHLKRQVKDLQGEVKFLQKRLVSMHAKYNDARSDQQKQQENLEALGPRKSFLLPRARKRAKAREMLKKKISDRNLVKELRQDSIFDLARVFSCLEPKDRKSSSCPEEQRELSTRSSEEAKINDTNVTAPEEGSKQLGSNDILEESETGSYFSQQPDQPRIPIKVLLKPKSIVYKWNCYADMEDKGCDVSPRHRTKLAKTLKAKEEQKETENDTAESTYIEVHNPAKPTLAEFLNELKAKQEDRKMRLQSI